MYNQEYIIQLAITIGLTWVNFNVVGCSAALIGLQLKWNYFDSVNK